jgi:hypothetical protein
LSDTKKIPRNYANRYLGYKFFKEAENGFEVIRVRKVKDNDNIKCINLDTGNTITINLDQLKEYTPLEPYGVLSVNIVEVAGEKDVVLILYKLIELKIMGMNSPYAICRQSVNDFFADLIYNNPEDNNMVGISCTRDNCPANIDFNQLATCDNILESNIVYLYRDDTLNSILQVIPLLSKIDNVLDNLYDTYCKSNNILNIYIKGKYKFKDGWCGDLKTLLRENNFMADFNSMCDITEVDFDIKNYLNTRESGVQELTYPALLFFDEIFKVNAIETRVIKYNYNIDLSKFNNTNYVFLRDNTGDVYLVVYLVDGEFLEKELEEKINKLDITERLQLTYFDKYSNLRNSTS